MSVVNINSVTITGNLTRDPVLRSTAGGTAVCNLRVAVNTLRKDRQTGEFGTKPNYFDVAVWGQQAENCDRYLAKGRPVAIEGRLEWREWQPNEDASKREFVSIVATSVQFLGSKPEAEVAAESSEGEKDSSSDSSPDDELMKLKRDALDELASDIGVETPEEYRYRRDVVEAIREKEAEKATADEAAQAAASDEGDIPF
jgi:single-strand DNA-binding protein